MEETKTYRWRPDLRIISGGYTGEPHGTEPSNPSWATVTIDNTPHTATAVYYYTDSDSASTSGNWAKVRVTCQETWTASVNDRNYLAIQVSTIVTSITRTVTGNAGTIGRDIRIRRSANSGILWSRNNDPVNTTHTIGSNINLGTTTIVIPPGTNATEYTIYYWSHTHGYPETSGYTDIMRMGIQFENTLPADYRPGKVRNSNGIWLSTNRNIGKCKILTDSLSPKELRTINGPSGTNNPPYILHSDTTWHNQRKIGQQ